MITIIIIIIIIIIIADCSCYYYQHHSIAFSEILSQFTSCIVELIRNSLYEPNSL